MMQFDNDKNVLTDWQARHTSNVHMWYTIQHRTVLITFSLILQTMASGGKRAILTTERRYIIALIDAGRFVVNIVLKIADVLVLILFSAQIIHSKKTPCYNNLEAF